MTLIVSCALIGHAVHATNDGRSRYFHTFSGGEMPVHTAVGLLRMAQVGLERTEPEEDE